MTYLLRLSACLFFLLSFNTFAASVFYVTGSGTIRSYDLEENTHSYITDGPWFAGGLAYQPSPVPLPAGIYLFLSGLVGLGIIKKRK